MCSNHGPNDSFQIRIENLYFDVRNFIEENPITAF